MTSQKKQIRAYLETGGKLTFLKALDLFGCANLKGRIFEIREEYDTEYCFQEIFGEPRQEIKTEMIKTRSGKRIAEYSLKSQ